MAKYSRLRERLVVDAVVDPADVHEAPAAAWDDLALVHTTDYLHHIACGTLPPQAQRRIGFPWSPQMVERARRSVGATMQASRSALQRGVAANLAGGTHHAFSDRGEGFCVFNDVAVAARALLRDQAVRRVAVIDCDVHQGNGTAAIFSGEPAVFTFSMHGAHNFPFRKESSDLDVTFEDGAGNAEYLSQLERHLPRVLDTKPDIVFYLAGADPYEHDRLGRLTLTMEGLRSRDRLVFDSCRTRSIPVVVVMAGGYADDVDAIVTIHTNTIREAVRNVSGRSDAPSRQS
jgi:acetoin utilization deacetylase AcuC-like enzyme